MSEALTPAAEPAASPAAEPAGTVLGGGAAAPAVDWKASLPDEIKLDPSMAAITDVAGLAKSFVHSQRMVGADKIVVPGKYTTPQEKREVYHKLGLPREQEKYEVVPPEVAGMDKVMFDNYAKKSYELGIFPDQAKALATWFAAESAQIAQKASEANKAGEAKALEELKAEWGPAYESKAMTAAKAVNHLFDDKDKEALESSGLGNNPLLIRMLSKIGDKFKEDVISGESKSTPGMTPAHAQNRIDILRSDPAYKDAKHPGHVQLQEEMTTLYKIMHPE